MRINSFYKICLVLIACCFSLLALELFLRGLGYKQRNNENLPSVTSYFWICDNKLGYKNRPNGSFIYNKLIPAPVCTTDRYGFRNGFGWSYFGRSPIILFAGDSTTFCAEVNDNETVPSEIAKLLKSFNVRVLNAGVGGYNTVQSKRMMEKCINEFPEIIIVIYVYCVNDYFENMTIYDDRVPTAKWSDGRLQEIEATDLSLKLAINHSGSEFNCKPGYIKQMINYIRSFSVLFHNSLLAVRKIIFAYDIDIARRNHADDALTSLVSQMNQLCESRGITFLTTAFYNGLPNTLIECTDYSNICKNAGITYIDISNYFNDDPLSYVAKNRDGTFDPHYNQKGTKTFAEGLSPSLQSILSQNRKNQIEEGR